MLGTADDAERDPAVFIAIGAHVFAVGVTRTSLHGREVLQLDATNPALRTAMAELVADLTGRCDGLRCDMAMLLLDDVFHRTWGHRLGRDPVADDSGFWPEVIGAA